MKLNLQLFALFLILSAGQTVSAATSHSSWTIAAELTKEMASMGYTMTSKNSRGALSFRLSKGAVLGEFVLGKKGTVTVPTWNAKEGKWVQTGTREVPIYLARVSIRLHTVPAATPPKSLKRYAKKPRESLLVITRRGHPAPLLEKERIPYTQTVAYTKSWHNGAKIERVITSTGPRKRIVAAGGVTFTERAGTASAPNALVQITLPFVRTRFGMTEPRILVASISVRNGNFGWAVQKYAKYDEIESAFFRAMVNAWPEEIPSTSLAERQSQSVSEPAEAPAKPEPKPKPEARPSTPVAPVSELTCPVLEMPKEERLGSSGKYQNQQVNKKHLSTIKVNAFSLKVEFMDGNPLYFPGNEHAWSEGSGMYPKLSGPTAIDQLSFQDLLELREERKGIAADGASQIIVVLHSGVGGTFKIELLPEAFGKEGFRPEPGKIRLLRDGKTCDTGEDHVAFAVYTAPSDFGRHAGMGPPSGWLHDGKRRIVESRVEWLDINFKPKSGDVLEESKDLTIVRPPVVLVHGAYDNAVGAWLSSSKLGQSLPSKTLPSLLEKAGFVPFLVDYESTNGKSGQGTRSSFWDNRFVVWNNGQTGRLKGHDAFIENSKEATGWLTGVGIEKARSGGIHQALKYFRDKLKIATTRADVIGHSMGGLLARVYASDRPFVFGNGKQGTDNLSALHECKDLSPYNPEYRRPGNFGKGDINRLITIGTPHHGSELPEIFNLITQQEIIGEGLKSQLMRTAAYYASWLGASKTADTAATIDLTRESCALKRIGRTDVRSHPIAGVTSAAALSDPVYGDYLQDFELMASLFYYNRELLRELFKQLAVEYEWDKKSTAEKLRNFEGLVASEYKEWIKLEKNSSDSWIFESANKTVSVPYNVIQHLSNLLFRFDKNDSTVRVDSQLAGLAPDSPFVTVIDEENTDKSVKQSVLHSFEPRYPLIQRKLVKLLWSNPEKNFAASLPPAGQKLKPHPFPDNLGVDLKLTGSFAKKWSGMDFRHADAFLEIAKKKKVVILARPVNPDSTGLIIRGAATKGMNVKGKSANWGPQKGYIPVEQRYSKLWRTAGDDRDKEIEEFNKKTRALLKAEKSVYQDSKGNPIAIGRQLKHSWNGDIFSVWMDPKVKDAEQAIYLCRGEPANSDAVIRYEKGEDAVDSENKTDKKRKNLERPCDCQAWFDWRTTGAGFDIKNKPMTPRQLDSCKDLRPLQVLADNTHPDKPFLTADYDLLTTGFFCPQGKNTPLEACQAKLKINKPEAVQDKNDPTCITGSTVMVNAEYTKGYPPEPMPCLDSQTGLITVAQVELLKALNLAVKATGYTGGNVSHHGPETQFFASPYVDYPITAFDPGIPGQPETARILSIPKGIKGFRDIYLKRFYEEKIRQGYWLYPNTADSANWHWQVRGTKVKWRGWFYDDAPLLRKTNKDVEQIRQPPCVLREIKRRKETPTKPVVECKQILESAYSRGGGGGDPDPAEKPDWLTAGVNPDDSPPISEDKQPKSLYETDPYDFPGGDSVKAGDDELRAGNYDGAIGHYEKALMELLESYKRDKL